MVLSSNLNFNLDVLSPNCVVSTPALMSYGITVFGFVILLSLLILIHCVSVLIFFRTRFSKRRLKRGCVETCSLKCRKCLGVALADEAPEAIARGDCQPSHETNDEVSQSSLFFRGASVFQTLQCPSQVLG